MTDYRTQHADKTVTHTEEAAFPGLTVVDLNRAASSVEQNYKNFVVFDVNDHCLRMAVMQGEFRWHHHRNRMNVSWCWKANWKSIWRTDEPSV